MTDDTEAFATRVPREAADRIERACEQTGRSRSDLVADALEYYVQENPDDIQAFRPANVTEDPLAELGILEPTGDLSNLFD